METITIVLLIMVVIAIILAVGCYIYTWRVDEKRKDCCSPA